MAAEKTQIDTSHASETHPALRLVNAPGALSPGRNAGGEERSLSAPLPHDDLRWIYAARIQLALNHGPSLLAGESMLSLLRAGQRLGLSEDSARTVIGIVVDAQARGGLDRRAMSELSTVPEPFAPELSARTRWIVFGLLFTWALSIAGLMILVSA